MNKRLLQQDESGLELTQLGKRPSARLGEVVVDIPPANAPPGGHWEKEKYFGGQICCIGLCVGPCLVACIYHRNKLDERNVVRQLNASTRFPSSVFAYGRALPPRIHRATVHCA